MKEPVAYFLMVVGRILSLALLAGAFIASAAYADGKVGAALLHSIDPGKDFTYRGYLGVDERLLPRMGVSAWFQVEGGSLGGTTYGKVGPWYEADPKGATRIQIFFEAVRWSPTFLGPSRASDNRIGVSVERRLWE